MLSLKCPCLRLRVGVAHCSVLPCTGLPPASCVQSRGGACHGDDDQDLETGELDHEARRNDWHNVIID